MPGPSLKAQQSERTKSALIAAGRSLFGSRGYAGVSAEEISAAANVTTGAVYHQFANKRGLFVAVFEAVEADVTAQVVAAASALSDPWQGFQAACRAFLEASAQPDVRQVLLIDGRSVLGWDEWHEIMARYGLGMTRAAVQGLVDAGLIASAPVEGLTVLLFGALCEAAVFVANAPDPDGTLAETLTALTQLLESLRAA
ncbi:MAG: TetR/AcrR family transcriptional regulator [Dehalococcoidia bacterium]